jgi:hypothetical protein
MATNSGTPAGHASGAVLSVLRNPELMAQVYLDLERSDLAQCVRVNRQMHASAAKALYHTVRLSDLCKMRCTFDVSIVVQILR